MSKPLLFQSKILCFSLLYLFSSLFLAVYTSLSQTKCLFRSSPFDPIQTPLFSYPSSYGEHKYAISTLRSTCSSPVYFSGTFCICFFFINLFIIEFFCFMVLILTFLLWDFDFGVRLLGGFEGDSEFPYKSFFFFFFFFGFEVHARKG